MPFSKYLQDQSDRDYHQQQRGGAEASSSQSSFLHAEQIFTHAVRFQVPEFIYSAAPTLALGGGAEVIPASAYLAHDLDNPWHSQPWCPSHVANPPKPSSTSSDVQSQSQAAASRQDRFQFSPSQSPSIHSPPPSQFTLPQNLSLFLNPALLPSVSPNQLDLIGSSSNNENNNDPEPYTSTGCVVARTMTAEDNATVPPTASQVPTSVASLDHHHNLTSINNLSIPSAFGLPVYSTSGFDLIALMARIATRPHPTVHLGPVDMSCSFAVVDTKRFDSPIVYCSPTFCNLTGYSEQEIIGRNCRFLQAPPRFVVKKGEPRNFTSQKDVDCMRKCLSADKECQVSIMNYRKDGTAFLNRVTIIPILGGHASVTDDEVIYHVGFQVDLGSQPGTIAQKLYDGTYCPRPGITTNRMAVPSMPVGRNKGSHLAIPSTIMSKELRRLLANPKFLESIHITTSTTAFGGSFPPSPQLHNSSHSASGNSSTPSFSSSNQDQPPQSSQSHLLSHILLESLPDFIHVVSLKGQLLYVAPSVRRVLGYEPEELVGKSISDFTHPEDVVPLMRELKESSATSTVGLLQQQSQDGAETGNASSATQQPRTVDLIFRARVKSGLYVWVECRGRLHVEPGKGRKAIILSGRAKKMPRLEWSEVGKAGGVVLPVPVLVPVSQSRAGGGTGTRKGKGKQRESAGAGDVGMESDSYDGGAVGDGGGTNAVTFDSVETQAQEHRTTDADGTRAMVLVEQEFWGTLSSKGTLLVVGGGVRDVLGWQVSELVGRGIGEIVVRDVDVGDEREPGRMDAGLLDDLASLNQVVPMGSEMDSSMALELLVSPKKRRLVMSKKDGSGVLVEIVLYRTCPTEEDLIKSYYELQMPVQGGDGLIADGVNGIMNAQGPFEQPLHQAGYYGQQLRGYQDVTGVGLGPGVGDPPIIYQVKLVNSNSMSSVPSGTEASLVASFMASPGQPAGLIANSATFLQVAPLASSSSSSSLLSTGATSRQDVQQNGIENGSASLIHDPQSNVFEELEVGRASSWQYELQQLRFANQRLVEEICSLEAELRNAAANAVKSANGGSMSATASSGGASAPAPAPGGAELSMNVPVGDGAMTGGEGSQSSGSVGAGLSPPQAAAAAAQFAHQSPLGYFRYPLADLAPLPGSATQSLCLPSPGPQYHFRRSSTSSSASATTLSPIMSEINGGVNNSRAVSVLSASAPTPALLQHAIQRHPTQIYQQQQPPSPMMQAPLLASSTAHSLIPLAHPQPHSSIVSQIATTGFDLSNSSSVAAAAGGPSSSISNTSSSANGAGATVPAVSASSIFVPPMSSGMQQRPVSVQVRVPMPIQQFGDVNAVAAVAAAGNGSITGFDGRPDMLEMLEMSMGMSVGGSMGVASTGLRHHGSPVHQSAMSPYTLQNGGAMLAAALANHAATSGAPMVNGQLTRQSSSLKRVWSAVDK